VTLIGLITKHGILIVDFANRLRLTMPLKEAVLSACQARLRPVLMTTLAMIFGAMPLLTSSGTGAIARKDIGVVIIGGMLMGTLFSLFVVPVAYALMVRFTASKADQ
jgi:multidrug efflux pump